MPLRQGFPVARFGVVSTCVDLLGEHVRADSPGQPPEKVAIIPTSSEKAAARMVDLFEIWAGALRFEDVEVELRP